MSIAEAINQVRSQIGTELEDIRKDGEGLLVPEAVINRAKNPDNILHDYFEWDDSAAAHQHRLYQARTLIRTRIRIIEGASSEPVSVYVSMRGDREQPGGGYRTLIEVMSDTTMRTQLLQEALDNLATWEKKYRILEQLVPIFEAATKIRRRVRK